MTHEHLNGFQHLDVPLDGLFATYDLGWKFEEDTSGPPGWMGDPFLLLYVSFALTTGETRRSGTLHYALARSRWWRPSEVVAHDRDRLLRAAVRAVRRDLASMEQGFDPPWLEPGSPRYLIPGE